jgi:hypothetical protein
MRSHPNPQPCEQQKHERTAEKNTEHGNPNMRELKRKFPNMSNPNTRELKRKFLNTSNP